MVPSQLMFLCLAVASFAPLIITLPPGWWIAYYYGTLLLLLVVLSVVAVRRAALEQEVERPPAGTVRTVTETENASRAYADAATHALAEKRLIIVARDQADLYDRISRVQLRDKAVIVITDRRSAERRHLSSACTLDRRQAERRRNDVATGLRAQGWAEVKLSER
jgi:hypothetical protein